MHFFDKKVLQIGKKGCIVIAEIMRNMHLKEF